MKKIALTMIFAGATLMAADGAALFAKCAGCHGQDGKTKALGKSNPIAGMAADEIVKDLQGYKAGTLNKHGMGGVMKGQAAALSDDDMKALADYISKLGK
ncbi:c-type cytochrome [Nitratifractor sp.]|uniref:c-type cytochrome n=1 Tax=Nitratifractor sp. TaxID=2268144 RepID=UPI0025F1EF9E|nr:c-type cytochrome [Nitratifractor sp.]